MNQCHKGHHQLPTPGSRELKDVEFQDGTVEDSLMESSDDAVPIDRLSDLSINDCLCPLAAAVTRDGNELDPCLEDADLPCCPLNDANPDHVGDWPSFNRPRTLADEFRDQLLADKAVNAASVLVNQAAHQTSDVAAELLPFTNTMLFLCLARLVMSSGLKQQNSLSKQMSTNNLGTIALQFVGISFKVPQHFQCQLSGFNSANLNTRDAARWSWVHAVPGNSAAGVKHREV